MLEFQGDRCYHSSMIQALILAAGRSERMGKERLKQLLKIGEKTLLEIAIDNLLSSHLDKIIIVLGYRAQEIREIIKDREVEIVVNPYYQEGIGSSIRWGARYISPEAEGLLIYLADQPQITPEIVERIIAIFRSSKKGIVVPTYHRTRGHPVMFHRRYKDLLENLKGDVGAKEIIMEHADDVEEVDIESPAILKDIDRWEEYLEVLKEDYHQ